MGGNFESITEAQIGFSLKFLQSQHSYDKSTVFSPISIAISLASAYLGTQGDTEKQIRNALAEGFDQSDILAHFTTLKEHITSEYALKGTFTESKIYQNDDNALREQAYQRDYYDPDAFAGCVLETFNRFYIDDNIKLSDDFVEKFNEFCQGGLEKVNFAEVTEVVEKINNIIAKVTRNKIKNIVSESVFDEITKVILINAIYFKGRWNKEFRTSDTKLSNFYMAPGKTKKAKMMEQVADEWRYSETEVFQFLTLRYQESDLSMRIILPRERYGLSDVLQNLTAEELRKHLTKKEYQKVIVKMPKFEIKAEFDATETLKSMGITDLFEMNANLERMSESKPIWISSILHSAYICTDEEGTEAASISEMLYGCGLDGPFVPVLPIKFTADHPFLYFITDYLNNIYFCGVVSGAEFDDGVYGSFYQQLKENVSKNPVKRFAKRLFGRKP